MTPDIYALEGRGFTALDDKISDNQCRLFAHKTKSVLPCYHEQY
ncbi:hypothetical protein [Psychrobacter coccoides]|nr:hypothetical protein [Psychrobacter coccoides]